MAPVASAPSTLKFPLLGELPLLFLGGVQQYAGRGATPTAPQPQQDEPVGQHRARNHSRSTSAQAGVTLYTECERCGEHVEMSLPPWMSAQLDSRLPTPQPDHRPTRAPRRSELRDGVVNGAVQCAVAIKQSPILPFLFHMAVTFFQCLHYLNKRFDLLAKAWTVLAAFLEGLLELEQKLSLCRQVGDGVSMAWETALRTAIEFGKADEPTELAELPQAETCPYPYPTSPLHRSTDGGLNLFADDDDDLSLSPVEDLPSFPAVSHRHLRRTAHSSPHLPLMISRSNSSSHLQPQVGADGDYAIFTGRTPAGVGAQPRRRSRSGGNEDQLQIPDVNGLKGWATRGVAGVVTRVGARITGVGAE